MVFSSTSKSFYPGGSEQDIHYYVPTAEINITQVSPAEYLNLYSLHRVDCIGKYDPYADEVLVDGPILRGSSGLQTPNLYIGCIAFL